ncbi:hypothetical protein SLS62_006562 [Diatrype stigma]|uniref:BTB domain-containing protein n=1 Tax=Diatrype stigma TaxID=117547 RepID=A0AAN9UQH9_9PEZI
MAPETSPPGSEEEEKDGKENFPHKMSIPKVSDGADIVTIEIPDGKKFAAHAHLLTRYSEYFRRALKSGMKEASSLHFCLAEHANNETVAYLINWVYDTRLRTGWDWDEGNEPSPDFILNAWLLADYLGATALQNHLVYQLFETHPFSPANKEKRAALQKFYTDALKRGDIRANSGMYRLIIALLSEMITDHTVEKEKRHSVFGMLDSDANRAIAEFLAGYCAKLHMGLP